MITRSDHFDLGRDKNLIKDARDGIRQMQTVESLLGRFFNSDATRRMEIQILADEVGMGKTFVALGAAYSVLAHLKQSKIETDLEGCYKRVLVLTPNNHALFKKWGREVLEFSKRCIAPEYREGDICFAPQLIERIDDLAIALRKGGKQPQVLIARVGLFGRDKLVDYELKRRFLLGTLFRFWGVRFNHESRGRLLKGAPDAWPHRADHLTDLTLDEESRMPFSEDELLRILKTFDEADQQEVEMLRILCEQIATPFFRDRDEAFRKVESKLTKLYRLAAIRSIKQDFPLLIVDEAHHWKNGPEAGTHGFGDFAEYIAPHIRRTLLLTATPFQLRPGEMLEILKVSDSMSPCSTIAESQARVARLETFREQKLKPALQRSEDQSGIFSRAWSRLLPTIKTETLESAWNQPHVENVRKGLLALAGVCDARSSSQKSIQELIDSAIAGTDPDVRQFLREALTLFSSNADLSCELGRVVVRHKRHTEHRSFRVGAEYQPHGITHDRPDRHLLHAAPGLDIKGEAELPQFLLMRCVSEMKKGRGRSSLGGDLTGCYSTLLGSAQGRSVQSNLQGSSEGEVYLDLLMGLVGEKQDPKHPKLERVVSEVIDLWRTGQKVLIFCVRVNTADRLRDIITQGIGEELKRRRKKCLGGEEKLKFLRSRITGRDRDLVGLVLDRFLWSLAWSDRETNGLNPADFVLTDEELTDLARLSRKFDVDVDGERVDRVFLNRATEHILAGRILREKKCSAELIPLLKQLTELSWIEKPYGLAAHDPADEQHGEETASFDERGCHTLYPQILEFPPKDDAVAELANRLITTRQHARSRKQIPVLDGYGLGPSLWFGVDPLKCWDEAHSKMSVGVRKSHAQLWKLRRSDDEVQLSAKKEGFDFYTRALVFKSLRRALLRESVLLRLLPEKSDLAETGWGELLTRAYFEDLPNQRESMADRISVFLEDLAAASGNVRNPETARGSLYQATLLRDQQFVALVKGGGAPESRERVFGGFNTPLLPEVLICTAVGQEGIDLHRHCRHVVHYDLPWNPAVLEQRTGRADRIGSKTFREREVAGSGKDVVLDIGVPFLAGTYDERTFEELRLRAQTFEVLTGGDFAADHVDIDDDTVVSPTNPGMVGLVTLPATMVADLRVKLEVYREG